jgi:hypothetical protein
LETKKKSKEERKLFTLFKNFSLLMLGSWVKTVTSSQAMELTRQNESSRPRERASNKTAFLVYA